MILDVRRPILFIHLYTIFRLCVEYETSETAALDYTPRPWTIQHIKHFSVNTKINLRTHAGPRPQTKHHHKHHHAPIIVIRLIHPSCIMSEQDVMNAIQELSQDVKEIKQGNKLINERLKEMESILSNIRSNVIRLNDNQPLKN